MPYTTTGGVKKAARYRYNFEMRRTPDSDNDFTNVFSLIDAANSYGTPNYVANMENMANMENWMRVFAANHAAGNWDSFGAQNAQNLYGYIGALGTKYSLLMWDFNIVLGNGGSWGPGQNLFTVNCQDPNIGRHLQQADFPAHVLAGVAGTGQRPAQRRQQRAAARRQIQCVRRQRPERRRSHREHRTVALPRRRPASPRNWPRSTPPISPSTQPSLSATTWPM